MPDMYQGTGLTDAGISDAAYDSSKTRVGDMGGQQKKRQRDEDGDKDEDTNDDGDVVIPGGDRASYEVKRMRVSDGEDSELRCSLEVEQEAVSEKVTPMPELDVQQSGGEEQREKRKRSEPDDGDDVEVVITRVTQRVGSREQPVVVMDDDDDTLYTSVTAVSATKTTHPAKKRKVYEWLQPPKRAGNGITDVSQPSKRSRSRARGRAGMGPIQVKSRERLARYEDVPVEKRARWAKEVFASHKKHHKRIAAAATKAAAAAAATELVHDGTPVTVVEKLPEEHADFLPLVRSFLVQDLGICTSIMEEFKSNFNREFAEIRPSADERLREVISQTATRCRSGIAMLSSVQDRLAQDKLGTGRAHDVTLQDYVDISTKLDPILALEPGMSLFFRQLEGLTTGTTKFARGVDRVARKTGAAMNSDDDDEEDRLAAQRCTRQVDMMRKQAALLLEEWSIAGAE